MGKEKLTRVKAKRVLTGAEVHELGDFETPPKTVEPEDGARDTGYGVRATGHGVRGTGDGVRATEHGSEPPSFLSTSGPIWTKADGTRMYKKKVSFPLALFERIETEAKAAGLTVSQYITAAVVEHMETKE